MEEADLAQEPKQERHVPTDRERWIAALSYIPFVCFFTLWRGRDNEYIHYHGKQGFLLLLAEFVALVLILILDVSIGSLRFIGLVLVIILQLVAGIGALILSVVGFVKALFGEYWHLPFLGDYRERVPGLHHDRRDS